MKAEDLIHIDRANTAQLQRAADVMDDTADSGPAASVAGGHIQHRCRAVTGHICNDVQSLD